MIRHLRTYLFPKISRFGILMGLGGLLLRAAPVLAQAPVKEVDRTTAKYLCGRYGCSFIVPKSS